MTYKSWLILPLLAAVAATTQGHLVGFIAENPKRFGGNRRLRPQGCRVVGRRHPQGVRRPR